MSKAKKSSKIEIENVGIIKHLDIPIEPGKVTVLQGRNGLGKTTALEATEAMTGKKKRVVVRDGTKKGFVEGLGVKLSVSVNSRRSGVLEVDTMEDRLNIATLVDPGIKKLESADVARIKSLVRLSGASVDFELFHEIFGGEEEFDEVVQDCDFSDDDLVETTRQIKAATEKTARDYEAEYESILFKSEALAETVKDIDVEVDHDEDSLAESLENSVKIHESTRQQRETGLARKGEIAEAREALAKLDQSDNIEELKTKRDTHEKSILMHTENIEEMILKRDDLVARINVENERLEARRDSKSDLVLEIEKAKELQGTIAGMKDLAEENEPTVPSQIEINKIYNDVEAARVAIQEGAIVRKAVADILRAKDLKKQSNVKKTRMTVLRAQAGKVESILSDVVGGLGTPLQVDCGRLLCKTTRSDTTPFCELSEGERWRIAIDIAIKSFPAGVHCIIVIPQHAWQDLDPVNRVAIAKQINGTKASILTAECSDGELQGELFKI